MNYKVLYKQALKRAKKLQETCDSTVVVGWCEYIFPELKESEEVRIKKTLIAFFRDWERTKSHCWNVNVSDILAWLEKQGEHKPYGQRKECEDCQFNYAGECKGFCQMKRDEQEPVDEAEPKFHIGDKIRIFRKGAANEEPMTITKIDGKGYWSGDLFLCNFTDADRLKLVEQNPVDEVEPKFKVGDIVQYITDSTERRKIEEIDTLCNMYHTDSSPIMFEIEDEWKVVVNAEDVEQESVDKVDFEKKELKKIEPKKLDPDKVIEWLNNQACQGWIEDVEVDKFIAKFKKDFKL